MTIETLLFALILVLAVAASQIIGARLPPPARTHLRSASALYFFLALTAVFERSFPSLAHTLAILVAVFAPLILAPVIVSLLRASNRARSRLAAVQAAVAMICCACAAAMVSIDGAGARGSALLFAAAGLLGTALAVERVSRTTVNRGRPGLAVRGVGR